MDGAEVVPLSEVRASSQWQRLRHDLHARFDQWLDRLQGQLPNPQAPLAEVTAAVWNLRHDLTGGLSATIVEHGHRGELTRQSAPCPRCERHLTARPLVTRTVETLVGAVPVKRPYFYCPSLDAAAFIPWMPHWACTRAAFSSTCNRRRPMWQPNSRMTRLRRCLADSRASASAVSVCTH
jgi:hypothetical protein